MDKLQVKKYKKKELLINQEFYLHHQIHIFKKDKLQDSKCHQPCKQGSNLKDNKYQKDNK